MDAGALSSGKQVFVWVDAWQFECCGDAFEVGSHVAWTVDRPDSEYFAPLFPAGSAIEIHWAEEHHSEPKGGLTDLEGTVAEIAGVQFSYAPGQGGSTLYPVAGSARLSALTRPGGAELRADGFAGYLVTLAE